MAENSTFNNYICRCLAPLVAGLTHTLSVDADHRWRTERMIIIADDFFLIWDIPSRAADLIGDPQMTPMSIVVCSYRVLPSTCNHIKLLSNRP